VFRELTRTHRNNKLFINAETAAPRPQRSPAGAFYLSFYNF
jgi:hypothetical protein